MNLSVVNPILKKNYQGFDVIRQVKQSGGVVKVTEHLTGKKTGEQITKTTILPTKSSQQIEYIKDNGVKKVAIKQTTQNGWHDRFITTEKDGITTKTLISTAVDGSKQLIKNIIETPAKKIEVLKTKVKDASGKPIRRERLEINPPR